MRSPTAHVLFPSAEAPFRGRSNFIEGAGSPARLSREGRRKLTESAKEFPKEVHPAESERVAPRDEDATDL